jgi:hypothetical protein
VPPRPAPFQAATPSPAAAPPVAGAAFDAPTQRVPPGTAFPLGAPPSPAGSLPTTREARPANPVLWYVVIALLGLTAAGLGVFRLTDSAWRDAQNTVMGLVLPGISVLAGIAGLATLALAVRATRGNTGQAQPVDPYGHAPDHARAGTDALR